MARPSWVYEVIESAFDGWVNQEPADLNLWQKLKKLRGCLRSWFREYSSCEQVEEARLRAEKEEYELQMESKDLDETDLWIWSECKTTIEDIKRHKARDLIQKSRIKWAS